ncbi:MAG: IS3 family transposase, partial [Breznakia sp.]
LPYLILFPYLFHTKLLRPLHSIKKCLLLLVTVHIEKGSILKYPDFKVVLKSKIEREVFTTLATPQLELELEVYIHRFNNKRIYSTLNYMLPVEYKEVQNFDRKMSTKLNGCHSNV